MNNNPPNPPCNTDMTDVERAIERLSKDLEREHGGNCNICLDETIVQRSDLRAAIAALLVSNRSGVEDLKHDLDRYMKIANIECNETERLREALIEIAEHTVPRDCEAAHYMAGLARTALDTENSEDHMSREG